MKHQLATCHGANGQGLQVQVQVQGSVALAALAGNRAAIMPVFWPKPPAGLPQCPSLGESPS